MPEPTEEEPPDDQRIVPEPRRDLRAEATSLRHLLLHGQKNAYCKVCQEPLAMRKANRRRRNIESFTKFGNLRTMHHVNAKSLIHIGPSGEKDLLVVPELRDLPGRV